MGENSQGNWTVIIDDGYDGDIGTFVDFQLIIHGTPIEDCMDNLSLNNQTIPAGTYEAVDYIHSNGTLATTTMATFLAGDSIVLKEGFYAESGSIFTAKIEACTNNLIADTNRNRNTKSTTSSLIEINQQPAVTIYPNPFAFQSNMSLSLPQAQTVNIYLMDALGRQVGELQNAKLLSKGPHDILLDLDKFQLNNGIYFIVSKIDDQTIAKKISILR